MKFINICNKVIVFCFYLLFFLVPLIFFGDTSELFEFNKMWLTFGLTSIIGFAWVSKMIFEKRLYIQRTPLDIFLLLFLLSQIIATLFSIDSYVSFWGYYSRFNGGLLSTISYVFLYYAFVSNVKRKHVLRVLQISLLSGVFVSLWGLPAHFGYDPTCYVFRGQLNVDCWTNAFQPKVRIFSTLGQPDWLAAYLAVLIPISLAFALYAIMMKHHDKKHKTVYTFRATYYIILTLLFYLDLLYTRARSGFISLWVSVIFFVGCYFWIQRKQQLRSYFMLGTNYIIIVILALLGITFFVGQPLNQLDKFTFAGLKNIITKHVPSAVKSKETKPSIAPVGELGGTDSGRIRLYVWRGAIDAWLHHPLFGTGVETFAFAYYQYRPSGHNLTSEWDYLYNKAHNEYLNYLATTGIFGLGTYLAMIGIFLWLGIMKTGFFFTNKFVSARENSNTKLPQNFLLVIALLNSYISILVSNFFGFSVVIVNLYLFFIPAFVFLLETMASTNKALVFPEQITKQKELAAWQLLCICIFIIVAIFQLMTLFTYWVADKNYALGTNYDHIGYYQVAHPLLAKAVEEKPQEPVFTDELAVNDAVLAVNFASQKNSTSAAKFAKEAIILTQQTVANHPNNVVYAKTQVRIFYTLSEIEPDLLPYALTAIQKASVLAPTDAKISYNLGLLYSQTGQIQKAIDAMRQTIQLKSDYRDAYFALSLFYHQAAIDKNGKVTNQHMQKKAIDMMHYILKRFSKDDKQVNDTLKSWGE